MFITFKKERERLLIEREDFSLIRHDSTRGVPRLYHKDWLSHHFERDFKYPQFLRLPMPSYKTSHYKPCFKKAMIKV